VNAMITGVPEGQAAIYGKGPVGLWFQSPGFGLTADQVNELVKLVSNPDAASAFHVADKRFIKLNCEQGFVVRGKSGEFATAAAVSNKAILILTGKTTPTHVSCNAEKYAADLKAKTF